MEPQDLAAGINPFKDGMKTIKIARIATVSFHIVSLFKEQIEYLRDAGVNVKVVSSDGPELSEFDYDDNLSYININICRAFSIRKDLSALIKLYRLFRVNRFDIVHSTTSKAGLLTAIAAFFARIPIRIHTFTGQPWCNMKGAMHYFAKNADRLVGLLNTKCYADSASQRQFLIENKIISPNRISVLGNGSVAGVNLKRFSPERWTEDEKNGLRKQLSIGSKSKVILFLGRITHEKGVPELVWAFMELLKCGHDVDLLLVGPHDHECGVRDGSTPIKINVCQRVHTVGYTDIPERYIAISDIICLPSHREGFGTSVIQAAAMAVPAIGTRINGLTDAVVDGQTGLLVPPHDRSALLRALRSLLDNQPLAEKLGLVARDRCVKQYDSAIVNLGLLNEYKRLLNLPGQ